MDLLLEAPVHPVQMLLLDADLTIPYGIVLCGIVDLVERGFLLSLSGHRAPSDVLGSRQPYAKGTP